MLIAINSRGSADVASGMVTSSSEGQSFLPMDAEEVEHEADSWKGDFDRRPIPVTRPVAGTPSI